MRSSDPSSTTTSTPQLSPLLDVGTSCIRCRGNAISRLEVPNEVAGAGKLPARRNLDDTHTGNRERGLSSQQPLATDVRHDRVAHVAERTMQRPNGDVQIQGDHGR